MVPRIPWDFLFNLLLKTGISRDAFPVYTCLSQSIIYYSMRIKALMVMGAMVCFLAACSDDEDSFSLQPHDENEAMSIMHEMMEEMENMEMTNDPEIDFAGMMIMHHQGAIEMANLELQEGKDNAMQDMAQMIIDDQTQEIQELQDFLETQSVNDNVPAFSQEQMENMEKMGRSADIQILTGDVDNDFATLMIVHHEGALDNARTYLEHGNNAELEAMAMEMINKQKQEIEELQTWLIENKRD